MPFEYAVRPFESRDPHGRIIIPSTPGSTHERATLTWGAKTTVNATKDQSGISVECCSDTKKQTSAEMTPDTITTEGKHSGQNIDVRKTSVAKFDKSQKDECAADWDQMSGVASAIDGAFASLANDIHASDSAFSVGSVDHCKTTTNYSYNPV